MTRLSFLKVEHSRRLPVGHQHYRQLMIEKENFDIFCLKKLINPALSQSQLQISNKSAMMKIYAKYSFKG